MANICKMCGESFFTPDDKADDESVDDDICDTCFADDFDGLDLEDKLEILLTEKKP